MKRYHRVAKLMMIHKNDRFSYDRQMIRQEDIIDMNSKLVNGRDCVSAKVLITYAFQNRHALTRDYHNFIKEKVRAL